MKKFSLDNLDDLALGSAILGAGGGGDSAYWVMMARYAMEQNNRVFTISISELKPDDLIVPIGMIGAPLAEIEKIISGNEFITLFKMLEKSLNKKITALMPFEIGGSNAVTPVMVAAQLNLPILDADMMGRAFPEAQMSSCHLLGASPNPGFITDCLDNTAVIYAKDSLKMEKIGRQVTVAMGSIAAFGYYPISGSQAEKYCLHKSISKAISIGKAHKKAKKEGADPLEAILHVCKGIYIGSGKIIDIDRAISKGFLNGTVLIQNKDEKIELAFQNEFLIAKRNGKIVATTPDIITLLEQETGTPISSEILQFGLNVNIIALPAPSLWTTPKGLDVVGPRVFGYDVEYQPIHKVKASNKQMSSFAYET